MPFHIERRLVGKEKPPGAWPSPPSKEKEESELLEELAELEHEQWQKWSNDLAKNEKITEERYLRWRRLWIPYSDLSEDMKEEYRKWARKVLEIIKGYKKNE